MKKSSFAALLLGTVSGTLFALGMCMALLPEWDAFGAGVTLGIIGMAMGGFTFLLWCKMEHVRLPKPSGRNILRAVYAVIAVLVLGVGMCLALVWNQIVWGTLAGMLGIAMLIFLIPMVKGIC